MYHKPINHPLPSWNIIVLMNFFYSALINHLDSIYQVYEAPPSCVISSENCVAIQPFVTSRSNKSRLLWNCPWNIHSKLTWSSKSWANPWKYLFFLWSIFIIFIFLWLILFCDLLFPGRRADVNARRAMSANPSALFLHTPQRVSAYSLFFTWLLFTRLCFFEIFYSIYDLISGSNQPTRLFWDDANIVTYCCFTFYPFSDGRVFKQQLGDCQGTSQSLLPSQLLF